jgi:hypothetical protein
MKRLVPTVTALTIAASLCWGWQAAPAHAATACQDAVAKAGAKYVNNTFNALKDARVLAAQGGSRDTSGVLQRERNDLRSAISAACTGSDLDVFRAGTCGAQADGSVSDFTDCLIKQHDRVVQAALAKIFGGNQPATPTPRPTPRSSGGVVQPTPALPCQPDLGKECQSDKFQGCCNAALTCVIGTQRIAICGFAPFKPPPKATAQPTPKPTAVVVPTKTPKPPTPTPTAMPTNSTPTPHRTPTPKPTKQH